MRQEVQDKSGQFHFSRVEETSRTFFANFESTFNALESLYKLISQFFFGSQVFFYDAINTIQAYCALPLNLTESGG